MAKRKLRVGVIFGGQSGEHEVSLAGAASVLAAIDRERFEAVPIGITREGRWLMGGDPLQALSHDAARRALAEGGLEASVKQELAARAGDATGTTALARMESSESLPAGLRERTGHCVSQRPPARRQPRGPRCDAQCLTRCGDSGTNPWV